MPVSSSDFAWSGRPPAIRANGGLWRLITANCSCLNSCGTKPKTPTPQGLSPSNSLVFATSASASSPRMRAKARKGRPPPSATFSANSAVSLTRVIAPWTIGYCVLCDSASAPLGFSAPCSAASALNRAADSLIASIIPAVETYFSASPLARAIS